MEWRWSSKLSLILWGNPFSFVLGILDLRHFQDFHFSFTYNFLLGSIVSESSTKLTQCSQETFECIFGRNRQSKISCSKKNLMVFSSVYYLQEFSWGVIFVTIVRKCPYSRIGAERRFASNEAVFLLIWSANFQIDFQIEPHQRNERYNAKDDEIVPPRTKSNVEFILV